MCPIRARVSPFERWPPEGNMKPTKKVRVLIVDDQPVLRALLDRGLSEDPEIQVVGRAADAFAARDQIVRLEPDVITLDVEMPRMNGLEFLRRLMPQYPIPVIMVSSFTGSGQKATLEALEAGAVDFVCKPEGGAGALESMFSELREKVKVAGRIDRKKLRFGLRRPAAAANRSTQASPLVRRSVEVKAPPAVRQGAIKIIAIGASTGGTLAIRELLSDLSADIPGIVMVQHMPAGFTAMFADNLDKLTEFSVKEARSGDIVSQGTVLIAPGDFHLVVRRVSGSFIVDVISNEKVSGHRPSVDVLFDSVAEQAGATAVGVLLTGMGSDGARGLLRMRANGARTIAQDEESSVVYGMPRVAYELGAVEYQRTLSEIPGMIMHVLNESPKVDSARI